jgi:hypothetical protein
MSRFDYVKYDDLAVTTQALFKTAFEELENQVVNCLGNPRTKTLIMQKLEEAYMWVGKAIRDDQLDRNGSAPLQEERKNG